MYSLLIIRNHIKKAPLFKISIKGPLAFASGNVPDSSGVGFTEPQIAVKLANESKSIFSLFIKILKLHKNNFFGFVKLQLNKTAAFINNYEISNNYNYYFYREYFANVFYIAFVNSGLIILTGILGIIFSYNKNNIGYFICVGYIFIYSVSVIGFYVISRFRIPVVMFFTIFSGA